MFGRNRIRYTGGITRRFLDIDFATMDKDGCVVFIKRFTGEQYEKLYYCQPNVDFPKDHFGNSNMQEWLDEHKDEVVGNIEEEVDMAENISVGESFKEDIADNEDVYPELPNIFNDKLI
ncbi:unnamed protein product [Lactuca saligna]|uniref:Uncharacterized protein n=1 Tax=Lactuca saligna TaxID=75948 RepID=A0AA35ZUN9_LACSI|nr:unnamed protein product [Lactuca saligna]